MPQPHEKELSALEKLLTALTPRPTALDRDRLLFRAGQQSMRRSWLWPCATVTVSLASCCLALVLVLRPAPEPVIRLVYVPAQVPAAQSVPPTSPVEPRPTPVAMEAAETPSPTLSYLRMQQQALRFGVEGLPQAAAGSDDVAAAEVIYGPDLSAGSRPRLINHSSSLSYGER